MRTETTVLILIPCRANSADYGAVANRVQTALDANNVAGQIVFVEQTGSSPLNYGALANAGFTVFQHACDFVCVQALDAPPEQLDYTAAIPRHTLRVSDGVAQFVAVTMPVAQFRAQNGLPNTCWELGSGDALLARFATAEAPLATRILPADSDAAPFDLVSTTAAATAPTTSGLSDLATCCSVVKTEAWKTHAVITTSMRSRVCLSMIVKDETTVVKECLESVAPHIDYWVIVDTGSTDGTQELIRSFFAERGVPGELHERPWVDFGTNRSEALQLCDRKADYAIMIDADDRLLGSFTWPDNKHLKHDCYFLRRGHKHNTTWKRHVFKTGIGWHWRDVIHEYPHLDAPHSWARIDGDYTLDIRTIGVRGRGMTAREKYLKDAEILKTALAEQPENARYQFYLGQSYMDAGEFELALDALEKRVKLGGWHEEVYQAYMFMAIIGIRTRGDSDKIQSWLLSAWNANPARAEPLVMLSRHFREKNELRAAHLFAKQAIQISFPQHDLLFVDNNAYEWQAADEFVSTAHAAGDIETGLRVCERLLSGGKLPPDELPRVLGNYLSYSNMFNDSRRA